MPSRWPLNTTTPPVGPVSDAVILHRQAHTRERRCPYLGVRGGRGLRGGKGREAGEGDNGAQQVRQRHTYEGGVEGAYE